MLYTIKNIVVLIQNMNGDE